MASPRKKDKRVKQIIEPARVDRKQALSPKVVNIRLNQNACIKSDSRTRKELPVTVPTGVKVANA